MKKLLKLALLFGMTFMVVGCVGKTAQRDAVSGLEILKDPTATVRLTDTDIYRSGEQLVVTGKVRAAHDLKQHGHVDVCVTTPDGQLIKKTVKVAGATSKRSGIAKLRFRAVFDQAPAQVSTVKARYHRGSVDCDDAGKCRC